MKKLLERSLALFLALVMCVSLMPVSALADETDTEEYVHEHSYQAVVAAPTCTEPGYTTYTCSCGDSYVDDYVDATGHNPAAVAEVPPTETMPGTAAGIICSECGEVLEGCGEIPALTAEEDAEDEVLTDENAAFASSGTCGTNVSWTLDDSGTLTISGTGTMTNYTSTNSPWYASRADITSIVVDGIKSIGDYAFSGCSEAEEITISSTVTTIGNSAFNGCTGLTGIALPSGLTELGYTVFSGCTGITEITIPASLTTASSTYVYGPFKDSSVTKVTFEEGMTKIPSYMLSYAGTVNQVVIPDSVTEIGSYAFAYCTALPSVTLPAALTTIGDNAFKGSSLEEVSLPDSLTTIGNYAFYGCSGLKKIIVPDTVTSIGNYAFCNCSGLDSISIPDITFAENVFQGCNASGTIDNGISWSLDVGTRTLTISGEGAMAFSMTDNAAPWAGYAKFVKYVVFDGNITAVAAAAFKNFEYVEAFELPSELMRIENEAFSGCAALRSIDIPATVVYIGDSAFAGCTGMNEMTFEGDAPDLGNNLLPDNDGLTVYYPEVSENWNDTVTEKLGGATLVTWDNTLPTRDVVLVLDVSGSMEGNKLAALKTAVKQFLKTCGGRQSNTRVAVISYSDSAYTISGFTYDHYIINAHVSELYANGGTYYLNALNAADMLLSGSDADAKTLILFSDGEPSDSESDIRAKAQQMGNLYEIYTVGFEPSESGRRILIDVAGDESRFYVATEMASLINAFKELAGTAGNEETVDTEGYYCPLGSTMFRIMVADSQNYSFGERPADFEVNVDGQTFKSDKSKTSFSDDITTYVPGDFTGNITISGDGYYTITVPTEYVDTYEVFEMYPTSYSKPYPQALMYRKTENARFSNNLLCESEVMYLRSQMETEGGDVLLYPIIDWNGHAPGQIWVQQILNPDDINDESQRKYLTADTLNSVDILHDYKPHETVYLCLKTESTVDAYPLMINIYDTPNRNNIGIDLGNDEIDIDTEEVDYLPGEGFKIDAKKLTGDWVPVNISFDDDGTFKVIIGLTPGNFASSGSADPRDVAYKNIKEMFKDWNSHNTIKKLKALDLEKKKLGSKLQFSVIGIADGTWFDGMKFNDIQLAILMHVEGSCTWQTLILGPLPGYFKTVLAGELQELRPLKYNTRTNKLELVGKQTIDGKVTLTFGLGAGWEGWFSGGVEGSGNLKGTVGLPFSAYDAKVSVSANAALVGCLFGIKGSWIFAETDELVLYKDGEFLPRSMAEAMGVENVIFIPFYEESEHLSEFYSALNTEDGLNSGGYPVLKTDTSLFSDPQTILFEDGTELLVWIDDVQGRGLIDASGLYYSYYDGENWSSPVLVYDDGTADFNPRLYADGDSAYIVWQNYHDTFGDSFEGIETVSEQVDIAVAQFSRSTATVENAHSFTVAGFDQLPEMDFTQGTPRIAWYNGFEKDTVMYSVYGSDGWNDAETGSGESWTGNNSWDIPEDYDGEEINYSGKLVNAESDNLRAILYLAKDENDVYNIFGHFNYEDSGWGDEVQISYLSGPDYIESFSATIDDSGRVSVAADVRRDTETDAKADLAVFTFDTKNSLAVEYADYERETNSAGNELSFYASVRNNSPFATESFKLRLIDSEGHILKSRIVYEEIPSGGSSIAYINYALPDDYDGSDFTVKVVPVDGKDSFEGDNSAAVSIFNTDISVEKVTATSFKNATTVVATIVNRGKTKIQNATITVRPELSDNEALHTCVIEEMNPGEVYYLNAEINPVLADRSVVYVVAEDLVEENIYANNSAFAAVHAEGDITSITLDKNSVNLIAGDTYQISWTVDPDDSTAPVYFRSTDENIATVDANGLVTAVGGGNCEIIAYSVNDVKATLKVSVKNSALDPDITLSIDKDYAVLEEGDGVLLEASITPASLSGEVKWSTADSNGEATENNDVISIDDDGTVHALSAGTAYAVASVKINNGTYSARCRIDVTARTVSETVIAASLVDKKATTELFKTDYTKIDVLLEMEQLLNPESGTSQSSGTARDNGAAIESAAFADAATANMFRLRVADDRTLEIVPTDEALNAPNTVAKSYKSAITVNVDGKEFTTDVLTLTVKKTVPKLKASAVKFNTYNAGDTRPIVITGGTVTGLAIKTALPSWMQYNGDMSLSVIDTVPAKASGKLTFNATVDGFTGTYPVTVSYSTASTAPKLTFTKSSLTLYQGVGGYAETAVKAVTPAEFAGRAITLAAIKEGTANITDAGILICTENNGIISVSWGANAPSDGLAHTYKVFYELAGKQFSFTVKAPKPAPLKLTLKAAGSIEKNMPRRLVSVAVSFANTNPGSPYMLTSWKITDKAGNDVSWQFGYEYSDPYNEFLILKDDERDPTVGTYTFTGNYGYGENVITKASVKFSVKETSAEKLRALAILKAAGAIDVIRPETAVTVKPTVNLFKLDAENSCRLEIGTMVNKVFTPMEDAPFDVTYEDGVFTVNAAEGASHTVKYYAKLTGIGGLENNKPIALPVKMGSAKFTADAKTVSLLLKDRYSSANVKLSTADTTLSSIDRVELDAAGLKFFKLTDLGGGTYAISYKDNLIPAGFRAGTAKTVKLNVFLDGNTTLKPNSTTSVKVTIQ